MNPTAPLKVLKASAGSGKTFSLTLHYLSLLLKKESRYREILAVTFTNKATAEMKSRILEVLHGLAIHDTSSRTDGIRQLLLASHPTWDAQTLQERAHRAYRRILHDYSHFTVSTIDGFSQKIIRSFTYELSLDSSYKVEMNVGKVKSELTVLLNQLLDQRPDLLEWIIQFAEKKIENNENWNYRRQLTSLAGLIFTENFQEFNTHLINNNNSKLFDNLNKEINSKCTEYLKATATAIESFKEKFSSLGIDADDLKGKSRNRLVSASKTSSSIYKLSAKAIGDTIAKFTVLIDNEDAFTDQKKEVRHDLIQAFAPILRSFNDLEELFPQYVAYEAVQSNLYYLRLLKEMSDLLTQWRKENHAQLISDSQILLNKLGLDENNDPTFIWEKIGNRYNYFLFDEFQDTSRIQWKNYSPLLINALGNSTRKESEHLIVGDVKQSIYRWRNGDWRILLQQVEEQIGTAFHLNKSTISELVQTETLDTNYRSLPNIIDFNNYLYETVPSLLQNALNTKVESEISEEGWVWWQESQNHTMLERAYQNSSQKTPPKKREATDNLGAIDLVYFPVENNRHRASQVMEASIQALCEQVGEWISTKKYEPKQIGILVRSNAQALQVIQALMEYKTEHVLAYDVISGDVLSLASDDAVQLLIETFKAMVYDSDQYALYLSKVAHLYSKIQTGQPFADDTWLRFNTHHIQSLQDTLPSTLIEQWEEHKKLPLVYLVEKLIEEYGLTAKNSKHLPYLLGFKDLINNFTESGERGIIQFLEYWEDDGIHTALPSNTKIDAIEVVTIHKSKGLAYDVVMIPFCSWAVDGMALGNFWIDVQDTPFADLGKIPIRYNGILSQSLFYKQYYEEMMFNYMDALNTLYVATTRAKSHLYISAPAFKEAAPSKGKDPVEPTGLQKWDIKSDYVSDFVFQALVHEKSPYTIQADIKLSIGSTSTIYSEDTEDVKDDADRSSPINLESYPTSKVLEATLNESSKLGVNQILMQEQASIYGSLAHEVIAEIQSEADIDTVIDRYIEEGIIPIEDRDRMKSEIVQIWHHPLIQHWLSSQYTIWNEASIIDQNGNTLRPDKVFTSADETIVLDFKFTTQNHSAHQKQVFDYMSALQNLGYTQIKGYLFYAKSNELIEVK